MHTLFYNHNFWLCPISALKGIQIYYYKHKGTWEPCCLSFWRLRHAEYLYAWRATLVSIQASDHSASNPVAILLFHFVPECREESWRQIEFSIFSAYGKKKFSWFFIYIISLVVSIRCGSVMIYLYEFFSKSEYVFSICIFELLLLEVIFYYVSECFYIAFGLFNLVMQILHFGSPLLIFYLNYCFCGFLITICLPIFFHSYLFSFFLASTIS